MPVFLIRHAHAGNRSSWRGEDVERPLSERGRDQARGLIDLLSDRDITLITSSPAQRCIETVEPLAQALGLRVELDKRLAEGSALRPALDVAMDAGAGHVLCAHGDLIPALMQRLVNQGMRASAPQRCQKGSVWEIELDGGRPVKARYRPPPAT